MRIIESKRLNDGKGFNQGQDSRLIHIESPADFDQLEANILDTDYYGKHYFQTRISHEAETIKASNLHVAAMLRLLGTGSLLELGCGRGDILLLLHLAGVEEVAGIDISAEVINSMWPQLADKVHLGDLLEYCPAFARQGRLFDTVVALDIWEHLHPARLDDYISSVLAATSADALFYFLIPAFGADRSFGEVFPLEFTENLPDHEADRPYSYLLADSVDPPIPVNGHLIWAPSTWWEAQFQRHGLTRAVELEAALHRVFDDHLFYAQRAFFIFQRAAAPGQRLRALAEAQIDQMAKIRALSELLLAVRRFERAQGKTVLDAAKTLLDLNHSLGLVADPTPDHAALLAALLRELRLDERPGDAEALRILKSTLDGMLHLMREKNFAQADGLAARWPWRAGGGFSRKILRGLARRRSERFELSL